MINRPPEAVWAFWSDPFNVPRLRGASLAYRPTSPGPMTVGSTAVGRGKFLGFEFQFQVRITEWDPPRRETIIMTAGPLRSYVMHMTIEPVAGGTRMVRVSDVELRPPWKVLTPLVRTVLRRNEHRVAQNLKRTLEAEAAQTS